MIVIIEILLVSFIALLFVFGRATGQSLPEMFGWKA